MAPAAAGRLIGGALLFAVGMILSAKMRSSGSAEGLGVLVIVIAGLLFAWLLNGIAQVRGLPLLIAVIGAAVALLGWATGAAGDDLPAGVTVFMALLLSVFAPSWTVGILLTVILVGSDILSWFL